MTVEAAATPIVELSDPQTVADKLTISPSLPEKFKPEAEQQELMKAGHEANARGDVKEALALFKQCYEAGERLEARISAANMLLKLGSQPRGDKYLTEAVAEFQAMLRQVNDSALQDHVRDKLLTLLFRKYKTSIDEAKKRRLLNRAMAEQMNPGSTRKSLRKSEAGAAKKADATAEGSEAGGSEAAGAATPRGGKQDAFGLHVERGTLTVSVMRALKVPVMDPSFFARKSSKSTDADPFVVLELQGSKYKTRVGRPVDGDAASQKGGKRGSVLASRAGEYVFPAERFEWRGELHELIVDDLGTRAQPRRPRLAHRPRRPRRRALGCAHHARRAHNRAHRRTPTRRARDDEVDELMSDA